MALNSRLHYRYNPDTQRHKQSSECMWKETDNFQIWPITWAKEASQVLLQEDTSDASLGEITW